MYCRNCGTDIRKTDSLFCAVCAQGHPRLQVMPSHLVFREGDGPGVWQVDGIAAGSSVSFLMVCDQDAVSVMAALKRHYPLEAFVIRGMKQLDGVVDVIQLDYAPWRLATARDASPAGATASEAATGPEGPQEKEH